MKRPATAALSVLAVLLALAVRLPTLTAGYPCMNYVDEGNFLHPVAAMLREGRWEPRWYLYPSLPLIAVATAARISAPWRPGDLPATPPQSGSAYDLLDPGLLVTGRVISLLFGLGIVLLAGRLAARLGGPEAGIAASFLAAVAPPLVIRGAIASVDPYAAFFVLAALLFAERLRTAVRSSPEAVAAGAMAGFAFAAKYPAVLVGLVPAWVVLRSDRRWIARLRLLVLIALGAVAAAIAAMPGLALRPLEVWAGIHRQGELYASLTSQAPLWRQAFVRAEWDLPYEHPELGAIFVLLALAGLVVALRERDLSTSIQGWALYAGGTILLFSLYSFHPFRNLLPLVAPACVLVALLYIRIRERLHRRLLADAGFALLLLSFAIPVLGYTAERHRLRDSRAEAVDWLHDRVQPGNRVLVLRDLAILPGELARLHATVIERRWPRVATALRQGPVRFLIVGDPAGSGPGALRPGDRKDILAAYEVRARFGEDPTPPDPAWWHGNRQKIYVLERRPPGVRGSETPGSREP